MFFNPFSGMNAFGNNSNPFADYMKNMSGNNNCNAGGSGCDISGKFFNMNQNPMMKFCQQMMHHCLEMMNSCCDDNICDINCHYGKHDFGNGGYDSFNIYSMMIKNCMNLMKKTLRMSSKMANSCSDGSCKINPDGTDFFNMKHDMNSWIRKLEHSSNTWSENFGKLHGEMMTFNEQAMNYVKLIDENIKVMKEQVEKSKQQHE